MKYFKRKDSELRNWFFGLLITDIILACRWWVDPNVWANYFAPFGVLVAAGFVLVDPVERLYRRTLPARRLIENGALAFEKRFADIVWKQASNLGLAQAFLASRSKDLQAIPIQNIPNALEEFGLSDPPCASPESFYLTGSALDVLDKKASEELRLGLFRYLGKTHACEQKILNQLRLIKKYGIEAKRDELLGDLKRLMEEYLNYQQASQDFKVLVEYAVTTIVSNLDAILDSHRFSKGDISMLRKLTHKLHESYKAIGEHSKS